MKKLIPFLLIFCPGIMMGQADSAKRETSVVFFGSSPESKPAQTYNSHAFKLGLTEFVSGVYGIYYEREFSDIFCLEVGGGLTGRNFLYGLGAAVVNEGESGEGTTNFSAENDIYDNYNQFKDRKAKIGYFIAIKPKLYTDEDGFDGSYWAFNFQYRRHNMEAFGTYPATTNQYPTYTDGDLKSGSNNIDEYENHLILALSYGYQSTNSKTLLDYSISAGMRKATGVRRDLGYYVTQNPLVGDYRTVGVARQNIDKTLFYFEISLKLGLWSPAKK